VKASPVKQSVREAPRRAGLRFNTEAADATPLPANPLADWIVKTAWASPSISGLVAAFAAELVRMDIPLLRLSLHIRTLHPLLGATGFIWHRGSDEVLQNQVGHEVFKSDRFLKSPVMPIYEGAGGIRRRLFEEDQPFDFPILEEIYLAGGTDYVAIPFLFSDGQINAITLSSDEAEGFSIQDLSHVDEVMPLLGRLVEVFASRYKAETLLETYLGRQAGREVLNGLIKRGDGRDIHAVIWFCDLRESTALADAVSRTEFLRILNEFFDCMAGAVIRHGGEVLRFIGDAALAIFPIDQSVVGGDQDHANACARALEAAADAAEKIHRRNVEAAAGGGRSMDFGIGLHIGDVTYGNIGTDSRLEFTVIGAAVNEAARIEGLCKTAGEAVLVSAEFVRQHPGSYRPLGFHRMTGVGREVEVFVPLKTRDHSLSNHDATSRFALTL
jgi:adenylate cyclase